MALVLWLSTSTPALFTSPVLPVFKNAYIKEMVEVKQITEDLSLKFYLQKEAGCSGPEFWNWIETEVNYLDRRHERRGCRVNILDIVGTKNNNFIYQVGDQMSKESFRFFLKFRFRN